MFTTLFINITAGVNLRDPLTLVKPTKNLKSWLETFKSHSSLKKSRDEIILLIFYYAPVIVYTLWKVKLNLESSNASMNGNIPAGVPEVRVEKCLHLITNATDKHFLDGKFLNVASKCISKAEVLPIF